MNNDYHRIEQAIQFIRNNVGKQPSLQQISSHVGLSPYHFQRLFRQWAGISPKRYMEFLTVEHGKLLLARSHSVMQAAYDVGLTGPSRLHEQFISVLATTPGEFKNQGAGLDIHYGVHTGPFGDMFIAQTQRGICLLAFVNKTSKETELARLRRLYRKAMIKPNPDATALTAQRIFQKPTSRDAKILLAVKGTNLQVNVWRALLQIPCGQVISYNQLAHAVSRPDAVRAVANAVAANPINMLIPCHRVLRANGEVGGYRGGTALKGELLAWEAFSVEHEEHTAPSAVDGPMN
jgi:AraC family transcriptional regulator of adaptative response/methylated-DNA-[protein]-cysteine methyltransferase